MADEPVSLSFRQRGKDKGGDPTAPSSEAIARALTRRSHVVLLIHGYNNPVKNARAAYDGFRTLQAEIDGTPAAMMVDIYWPGEWNWGFASALSYSLAIGKARESARLMAAALQQAAAASGLLIVDVVAHSLGCRLTLEALWNVVHTPGLSIRRIALMAAAVPLFKLGPGEGLRLGLNTKLTDSAASLFSTADRVLKYLFRVGQAMAPGDEGILPVALGHDVWIGAPFPPRFQQYHIHGAGHSDYWGKKRKKPEQEEQANDTVNEFLELGAPSRRSVAARTILSREAEEPRGFEEDREVEGRNSA